MLELPQIEFKSFEMLKPIVLSANSKEEALKVAQALSASPLAETVQVSLFWQNSQDSEVIFQWAYEPPF